MFRASFYGNRIFPERVFYRHEATEIADFILQEREGIHAAGKIYAPGNGTCRAWQRMDKDKSGVGAVLVKEDRIIGEGYHKKFGGLHAEREALADCRSRGEDPAGADLYVTLEPCCHYGKTPPCTQAVIEAGISHVFVGAEDINPLVAGAGSGS